MKRISTVVMESYRLAQYAESLSCYLCGEDNGFDWVRCHYCHAPLALAQSAKKRREIHLLTAVGSPGCGKTSLLGAMMELLTRPQHEVQLRVCNSLSLSLQESTLISLSQGTFPAATQMEPEHWNWVHCELRKGKSTKLINWLSTVPADAFSGNRIIKGRFKPESYSNLFCLGKGPP